MSRKKEKLLDAACALFLIAFFGFLLWMLYWYDQNNWWF
jgi:hypothetical protein